jgi:cytochrome c-type biogenesis protein CcmH/NrfG
VPVAHEVEGLPALEPLIAGPEVDRRVVAALRVEVAAVDVEPDTAELVDALAEAVEVDADQEMDRKARQLACPA